MIDKSDVPITNVISRLSNYKIAAAYLVPTPTGMEKSIMDATAPLRNFLKENSIHNYDAQLQGTNNKKLIDAQFIFKRQSVHVSVSLYRPETKFGDPRIWIYGLGKHANPFNLLALFVYEGSLYIFNASDKDVLDSIDDATSPLGNIASKLSGLISSTASELLTMLRERTGDQFIESMRAGDTGIGATLETLLGIKCNSSKAPDYKGIEIKSSRHDPNRVGAANRVNLFSQVPDWKTSPVEKAINMLKQYGYVKDNRLQLYCSLSAIKPNSQGLMLSLDEKYQLLKTVERLKDSDKSLLVWAVSKLKERLEEKHPESFWVKAEAKVINGKEHFRYYKVVHTAKPILSNLDYLLSDGTVSLDLTMSQKSEDAVRDHGYIFKIWPENFNSLFPPHQTHTLY